MAHGTEREQGSVALVSTGSGGSPIEGVVLSQSGRDLFFRTAQGLVSQDTDGEADIYDARLGGGFPSPAAPLQECSGDACQGPLTNPAPLLVPGSVVQAPGDRVAPALAAPAVKAKQAKPKKKVKSKKKSVRRTEAR